MHEIPVGPVHAGIIEPGHFRFSIVGEKVLRLEERLGYATRASRSAPVDAAPEAQSRRPGLGRLHRGLRLGLLPGDGAHRRRACRRGRVAARAVLERERMANHLGDLGALGNDAAFAFGLSQFSRLKEDWLRHRKRRSATAT